MDELVALGLVEDAIDPPRQGRVLFRLVLLGLITLGGCAICYLVFTGAGTYY